MIRQWLSIPLIFVIGALILLIVGAVFGVQSESAYRAQKTNELEVQADILATTVMAALVFGDTAAAQESVDALLANPEIEVAAAFDDAGNLVAGFSRGNAEIPSSAGGAEEADPVGSSISVVTEVAQGGQTHGSIYLRSIGEPAWRAFTRYIGLGLLITMAVLLVGIFGYFAVKLERTNSALRKHASDLADSNTRLGEEMQERQRAEEALRHSQKMEAIGQLSGGIAHDFNNLLTIVSGNLQLARRRLGDAPRGLERYMDQALDGLERASTLTQRILAFSRKQSLSPRTCDLNKLVTGMMALLRNSVDESIALNTQLNSRWSTHCDVNQMENVLINLALNARDAMPGGGRLVVETADVTLKGPSARYPEAPPGEYVELSMTDNGTGMSEEVRSKAIDPFFTTKPQGRGTGLGLSMIFGVVTQSGGYLSIESEEGKGTRIGSLLPRFGSNEEKEMEGPRQESQDGGAVEMADPRRAHIPGAPTILIVEDEALLRILAVETFQDEGLNVLEARDGNEALEILNSDAKIDLLLTDVKLPHFNGFELVERSSARRPSMKVIFVTGYSGKPMSNEMRDAGMKMISKPYKVDELVSLVRDLLGQQGALGSAVGHI